MNAIRVLSAAAAVLALLSIQAGVVSAQDDEKEKTAARIEIFASPGHVLSDSPLR